MSKICPCPHPPGGHIVCEDNQFGMCAYKDGKKVGGCLNIPNPIRAIEDHLERNLAVANWVLSTLMDTDRDPDDIITADALEILMSGEYINRGVAVRFSLPQSLDLGDLQVRRMTMS